MNFVDVRCSTKLSQCVAHLSSKTLHRTKVCSVVCTEYVHVCIGLCILVHACVRSCGCVCVCVRMCLDTSVVKPVQVSIKNSITVVFPQSYAIICMEGLL